MHLIDRRLIFVDKLLTDICHHWLRVCDVWKCAFISLRRELLTPQQHYDWGLRALKTVLKACGSLLQQQRRSHDKEKSKMPSGCFFFCFILIYTISVRHYLFSNIVSRKLGGGTGIARRVEPATWVPQGFWFCPGSFAARLPSAAFSDCPVLIKEKKNSNQILHWVQRITTCTNIRD